MTNETKNQEFNRSIKQLQAMVRDKMLLNLAEKFYNLKNEMSGITRSVKEKETALLLADNTQKVSKHEETDALSVSDEQKQIQKKN